MKKARTTPLKTPAWDIWLALGLVYIVWGSTYLGIRLAIDTIPPFLMAGMRFLVSGLLLFGVMMGRGEKAPSGSQWRSAAMVGFLLITVANGGVSWVERWVPSGITALLVGTVPLWMALLEWVWKKKGFPPPATWAGIFLGMGGIALLVFARPGAGAGSVAPLAASALVGTSLVWAFGSLLARSADLPKSALLGTSMEMITGGFFQLVVSLFLGEFQNFHPDAMSRSSILSWVYLTLIGSLVGFTSYIWVLKRSTPELASTYAFVNPVIAVILGWALAGEALDHSLFLAMGLIVTAVVLITMGSGKKAQK